MNTRSSPRPRPWLPRGWFHAGCAALGLVILGLLLQADVWARSIVAYVAGW